MKNSIPSTNSLKGLAIVAVLINHYLNENITGDYGGFAHLWISIFYFLSGYGIFFSLERSFLTGSFTIKKLLLFYFHRFIRIFPLLWIALFLEWLIMNQNISLGMMVGITTFKQYWFIPTILQCYIIAPLVFFLLQKNRNMTFLLIVTLFVISNIFLNSSYAPQLLVNGFRFIYSHWRNIFFFNVFLFSISMIVTSYAHNGIKTTAIERNIIFLSMVLFSMFIMVALKYKDDLLSAYYFLTNTLYPIFFIALIVIFVIKNNISFYTFSFLGKISFSIYLFHMLLYGLINNIFKIEKDSLIEFLIVLMCLPLFFFICNYTEKVACKIAEKFRIVLG